MSSPLPLGDSPSGGPSCPCDDAPACEEDLIADCPYWPPPIEEI